MRMMRSAFSSGSSSIKPPVPPSRHSTPRQGVLFQRPHYVNANAFIAHQDVAQAKHQRLLIRAHQYLSLPGLSRRFLAAKRPKPINGIAADFAPCSLFPCLLILLPVELPSAYDRGTVPRPSM